MRELREEFRLLVVLEVGVALRQVDLETAECSGCANLSESEVRMARRRILRSNESYTLAVGLLRDRPESTDGRHFVRRGES